jgi:hypothetical protein
MKRRRHGLAILLAIAAAATPASALLPDVQSITTTDVTPRSFSVVWLATPGASPSLRVFEGPACEVEVADAVIESFPTLGDGAIPTAAANRGVMKVRVAGLRPDHEYCYQTLTTGTENDTRIRPLTPAPVRTAARTSKSGPAAPGPGLAPFANDLIRFAVDVSSPEAPTEGLLLVARVDGAGAPITAFIGDGIDDDADPSTPTALVLLDLNNLYAATGASSLDLSGDGGEGMVFLELGGSAGAIPVHARIVPPDDDLNEIKDPLICGEASAGRDCDGILADALGDAAAGPGDPEAIAEVVVGASSGVQCPVCADVDFDGELTIRDALAVAQYLAGLGTLP